MPKTLHSSFPVTDPNETIFYFPFDRQDMPPENAYSDILEKLKNLVYPTLFLTNLEEISWKTDRENGLYRKVISERKEYENLYFEKIELIQEIGLNQNSEIALLFTRKIENQTHSYSIGFFLDNEKNKLFPKPLPAFCFFPTKEVTNLNFIIHGPFLLTDSREGIKKGQTDGWNEGLIAKLAQLSADSLVILRNLNLIDDEIIKVIPYKESEFFSQNLYYPFTKTSKLFAPFYNSIKSKLQTEELLPSLNGDYSKSIYAFWASAPTLPQLFSNEQLGFLFENKNAKWIFPSLGYNNVQGTDKELASYISDLSVNPQVAPQTILNKINSQFTEGQKIEWLHQFYAYLSENSSYQSTVKTKPIFWESNGKAAIALTFDSATKKYEPILFLPDEQDENFNHEGSLFRTVHPELLKNEKSKEFIESFGIKKPSIKDEITNHILPFYAKNGSIDTVPHFKKFLKYWIDEGRPEDFIDLIKDKEFILFNTKKDEVIYRGRANTIYFPSSDLQNYFDFKHNTRFVLLKKYHEIIPETDWQNLKEFLLKIGVSELPRISEKEITDLNIKNNIKSKYGESLRSGTYGYSGQGTFDKVIDGCSEILDNINKETSEVLWKTLSLLSKAHENLHGELTGIHKYFYYSQHHQYFDSTILTRLKTSKWLLSIANEFVAPCEISLNELAKDYIRNRELEETLDFRSPIPILSEKEIFINSLSDEEFLKLKKWKEIEDDKKQSLLEQPSFKDIDGGLDWLEKVKKTYSPKPKTEQNNQNDTDDQQNSSHPLIDFDEDQEFEKGIDNLKKQIEIKKLRSELIQKIEGLKRYSYDWFESFLKLLNTYVEKQTTTQQKTVSFQEIRHYKTDNKYFLLKGANTYVSSEIEDASDIKLKLIFKNRDYEPIIVEGVSKKGQDLLVYCPNAISQPLINRFADVARIEIQFTPAIDLLERLYKAFINRNYIDEWIDIQDAMPPLNYIYGPPGTGKTTTLCNKINQILQEDPNAKFLILTPTNKAADVICNKLLLTNAGIKTVRLGKATDPDLEGKNIYRDSLYNNDLTSIDVVASTIHRLPYFEINDYGLLFQYQWDYVIFDESSMAGLHYIVFAIMALYKTNSDAEFIVAGDPKQIPPVIEVTDKELESFDFQDENIYKMMGLVSFDPSQQKIRVYTDSIINLDNQYRSLPQIGHLFSELSYSKLLKHDREINRSKSKPLPEKFRKIISENVSFINIPLNQDNSIYKVKKLIYSSYHTYCAILVAEIIKFFDQSNDGERDWTIGLIAPYKAQAILLNKLITSYGISEYVKVISDTVHGFQGDECDIVFFVCNPNNYYYTGHSKCLLSKEYIYNVAISRAMDYLVILHPFTVIDKNVYINKIAFSHNEYSGHFHFKSSSEIEKQLLGDERFIENNAFTTGHDNVNVFGLSDMKYFIKANETAIDIQIRDLKEIAKAKPIKHDNYIPIETPPVEGVKIIGKIDLSQFDKYKKHKNH